MKRIVYALLATVSGVVLLFSYRTSLGATASVAAATPAKQGSSTGSTGSTGSSASSQASTPVASATPSASSGSTSTTTSGLKDGTYTGQAEQTRYGAVQVQITVSGGRITNVTVPEYPSGNGRDQQINSYAIPQLVTETLSAQSADVDMVSGATYTSRGYLQSLQSAIDAAS